MNSNPYESPKTVVPVPLVVYTTRWKAIRAGMWRDAKIGFFTVVIFLFFAATVAVVIRLFLDGGRLPSDLEHATWFDVVKGLGMFALGLCAFGALYGAIPGAVILGVVGAVRWRRPAIISDSQTPALIYHDVYPVIKDESEAEHE